jgi:hypothetical protein
MVPTELLTLWFGLLRACVRVLRVCIWVCLVMCACVSVRVCVRARLYASSPVARAVSRPGLADRVWADVRRRPRGPVTSRRWSPRRLSHAGMPVHLNIPMLRRACERRFSVRVGRLGSSLSNSDAEASGGSTYSFLVLNTPQLGTAC